VQANVPYGVEYVERLSAMVRRHLPVSHEVVCLTDRPRLLPKGVRGIEVPSTRPLPGWWAKVGLFAPGRLAGRVLYLDLDVVVVSDLTPVVSAPGPMTLIPDAGTFKPRQGLQVVKRFNSSVMAFDAEAMGPLWQSFSPSVPSRLWGDQDWIGEQMPDAAMFPLAWFPRLSAIGADGLVPAEAKVILSKKPKNHVAAAQWPWFDALWRVA
jgi:hypothetical protein